MNLKSFGIALLSCLIAISASAGTVPFILDGNRVYAQVEFVLPDGAARKALVFVDMGSPSMVLSKELYDELHVRSGESLNFRIGDLTAAADSADISSDTWFPFSINDDRKVEGLLPAGIMRKYQVRFDYLRRTMTLAQPGTLPPEGIAVPLRVNEKTGLVAIQAAIDGHTYPITIDNGSGYTWIRKSTAEEWLSRHPDWQRGTGAVGASNMRMGDDGIESTGILMRLPEIGLGSLNLRGAGALAIGPDNGGHEFMDWYSTKNAVPVIGWLGGNVLRAFRITIDYPKRLSYWVRQSGLDIRDLNSVGLTLVSRHREYFVGGIATQNGRPTVQGVRVGDKLVRIGRASCRERVLRLV